MSVLNRILTVEAGAEAAGKMELTKTSVDDAVAFAKKVGLDFSKLPDMQKNFEIVKAKAKTGSTKRKEMPVIDSADVKKFQARLKKGTIDVEKPFAKDTDVKNPFPEGLSGTKAITFLKNGLRDGSKTDDIIPVRITQKKISSLKPIQKQIYYDKSMKQTAKNVDETRDFLQTRSFFISSADDFIIDGHHRWLSGMLVDPEMEVNVLEVDLPIKKLLPLSAAYGDAIGNKRNA